MSSLRTAHARALSLGLVVLGLISGCNRATAPSPVLFTDTLSGILAVAGTETKTFAVTYTGAYTSAGATITALTTVGITPTPVTTTVGVGFGNIAPDGSCQRSASYTRQLLTGQTLVTDYVFLPGTFCLQIYDAGTLTGPTNYTVKIEHY